MSTIAVTGVTGRLGGRIARSLAEVGVAQRLVVRDPARAPVLAGSSVAVASYGDASAARAALTGASTVLMVSASETVDRVDQHRTFVDAAVAAGVEHLVYISFFGAAPDATFTLARDHWATEEHLRASGLQWTILRDNMYSDILPAFVGPDGVIRGPAGDGRVAAVAQRDIADVATAVLTAPGGHDRQTYDLTGPAAITLDEVAAALGTAPGRPISYHPETIEEAYASRAGYGAPDWQVDAWVSTYAAIAKGELAGISDAVERVTGHEATSFGEVLRGQQRAPIVED